MTGHLRIGFIITQGEEVPAWYYRTIDEIRKQGCQLFFLFVQPLPANERSKPALYRLFEKFEARWFQSGWDAASPLSLQPFLQSHPAVHLAENAAERSEQMNALHLDVVYTIEADRLDKAAFSKPGRYGLWYIRFGYGKYLSASPPAFWEVMNNSAVTGSYLLIQKGTSTYIAYEGTTRTIPYSVKNNFNSVAWKASSYLPFRLPLLADHASRVPEGFPLLKEPAATGRMFPPSNAKMPALFLGNVLGYLAYKIKSKLPEGRFTILYSFNGFQPDTFSRQNYCAIPLPDKDRFYADPFVMQKDGSHYIFFEEMSYQKGRAHISLVSVNENKEVSTPVTVLEKPYHLSYPFVLRHDDDYYMIPETASNKTVELYKATRFPYEWEHVMNLMEAVELMDATIHFENGKWWLFANSRNHAFVSTNDQLFLFYSDQLFSKSWTPHPQNPVATHAGNCRPAGRIFRKDNKLYRPAQNNASQQYGYGLTLNEIEVLTETIYQEKEVYSYQPETMGLKACHHLDFTDSLIVIDGIVA